MNIQTIDKELGVTPLPETINQSVENVMSNNFGFGGTNGVVIFKKI